MDIMPFEKTLLSKEISKNIKNLIINRKLKPGDKLPNEIELSQMMGVSRSTVREAIKILASANIVEVVRGKGTFVSKQPGLIKDPLGVKFIHDKNLLFSLFEARILVEPGVAYLAAERATKSDITKIKESMDRMCEIVAQKKAHKDEDLEYHLAIAKATKNPIIQRIVPIINESIVQGYFETVNVPGSAQKAVEAHRNIYNAIKDRDPAKAREMMEKHLKEALEDIKLNVLKD